MIPKTIADVVEHGEASWTVNYDLSRRFLYHAYNLHPDNPREAAIADGVMRLCDRAIELFTDVVAGSQSTEYYLYREDFAEPKKIILPFFDIVKHDYVATKCIGITPLTKKILPNQPVLNPGERLKFNLSLTVKPEHAIRMLGVSEQFPQLYNFEDYANTSFLFYESMWNNKRRGISLCEKTGLRSFQTIDIGGLDYE